MNKLKYIVYLIIFVSPLIAYRQDFIFFNITLQRVFLSAGLLFLFIAMTVMKKVKLVVPAPLKILLFYIGIKTIDLIRTTQVPVSAAFILSMLAGWLIILLMVNSLKSEKDIKMAVNVMILALIFPAFVGVMQLASTSSDQAFQMPFIDRFSPRDVGDNRLVAGVAWASGGSLGEFVRIGSTLGGPTAAAEYFTLLLFLILWIKIFNNKSDNKMRLLYLIGISILFILVLATGSREGFILFAIGSLFTFIFSYSSRYLWKMIILGSVMVMVLTIAVPLFIPPWAVQMGFGRFFNLSDVSQDERLTGHIDERLMAIECFKMAPVMGVGLGNLGQYYGMSGLQSPSESAFLTALAEGGAMGISVLIFFALSVSIPLYRSIKHQTDNNELGNIKTAFVLLLIMFFANNMLSDSLYRDTSWIYMGMGISLLHINPKTMKRDIINNGI